MSTLNRRTFSMLAGAATLVTLLHAPPAMAESKPFGNKLTFALSPEPPFLFTAINTTLQMGMVSSKIHESLLKADHEFKIEPLLAKSWQVSPDGLTYTFSLRPGVKWHDGKEFTSADVRYTVLELLKKVHPRGRTSFAKVVDVETPDSLTAVIKLSSPAPQILVALASSYESPMVPRHIYEGTDVAANPHISKPIGTGPFVFKEWQKGSHIILEKNPSYWDPGKPHLEGIVFRIINDASARAVALESGEAQIAGLSPIPLTDMPRIEKLGSLSIETRGYAYMSPFYLIEVNTRKPPLNDVRVRQAMAHAIDREKMTKLVWMGYGKPAISPIPSTIVGFHNPENPSYALNLDKAKALLDEAGYKAGPDGKRFKIMHDFIPLGSDYQRTAEFLKQQLARVGIELEIRSQDLPTFFRRIYSEYDFDTTSLYYGAFADPTQGVHRLFWSRAIQKGVVFTNAVDYRSADMDALLEAAQSENDPAKRKALYRDMQALAMKDLPVIPLMETRFTTVANKRLKNHTLTADGVIGGNFADVTFE